MFYGTQTLTQLLPQAVESQTATSANWTLPAVRITDYPRFGWRGIMLDVSRHFFPKEDVKRYIDQLARLKYNTFHWHLTDDNGWRIEIKSLPKLTEVGAWRVARSGHFGDRADPKPGEPVPYGGFYTQDDIKEIVAYARARNVTIVPEIDVPGHSMAALAAYPELSCTKAAVSVNPGTPFSEWYGNGTFKMKVENTLNPSDEKVYAFLDKVFTEVAALFPNPYIHVGGDECYKGYWAQDTACQALMKKLNIRHVEDLQGYFMSRVEKILDGEFDEGISEQVRQLFQRNKMETAEDYQGLSTPMAAYAVYGVFSERVASSFTSPDQVVPKEPLNLRNPVVEQVVNETLRLVRDVWKTYGRPFEIHIELARELRKNRKEREEMTKMISENEQENNTR